MKKFDFKKILALVIVLMLALSLVACSNKTPPTPEPPTPPKALGVADYLTKGIVGTFDTVKDVLSAVESGKVGANIGASVSLGKKDSAGIMTNDVYSVQMKGLMDFNKTEDAYSTSNGASIAVKNGDNEVAFISLDNDKLYFRTADTKKSVELFNIAEFIDGYSFDATEANVAIDEIAEMVAGMTEMICDMAICPLVPETGAVEGETYSTIEGNKYTFVLKSDVIASLLPMVSGLIPGIDFNSIIEKVVYAATGDYYEFSLENSETFPAFGLNLVMDMTDDGKLNTFGLEFELMEKEIELQKYEYVTKTVDGEEKLVKEYVKDAEGNIVTEKFTIPAFNFAIALNISVGDDIVFDKVADDQKADYALTDIINTNIEGKIAFDEEVVDYVLNASLDPRYFIPGLVLPYGGNTTTSIKGYDYGDATTNSYPTKEAMLEDVKKALEKVGYIDFTINRVGHPYRLTYNGAQSTFIYVAMGSNTFKIDAVKMISDIMTKIDEAKANTPAPSLASEIVKLDEITIGKLGTINDIINFVVDTITGFVDLGEQGKYTVADIKHFAAKYSAMIEVNKTDKALIISKAMLKEIISEEKLQGDAKKAVTIVVEQLVGKLYGPDCEKISVSLPSISFFNAPTTLAVDNSLDAYSELTIQDFIDYYNNYTVPTVA